MRRADRLYRITLLLSRGKLTRAQELAQLLEVSERTIYRDMAELVASGVPVQGEAGVGYQMRGDYTVPPMMFTDEELQALMVGGSFVQSWADTSLGLAAQTALAKIATALPEKLARAAEQQVVMFPDFHVPQKMLAPIALLRAAIAAREKVRFDYTRIDGAASQRLVWPLGLFFWGQSWTLGGWCELREEFRTFRLDRMRAVAASGDTFPDTRGRRLKDYIAAVSE